MNFGENFGLEKQHKEYKELNFFSNALEISKEDATELVNNNKWLFNDDILLIE